MSDAFLAVMRSARILGLEFNTGKTIWFQYLPLDLKVSRLFFNDMMMSDTKKML